MPGQSKAIEQLLDLLSRELAPEQWAEVDEALAAMAAALTAGDDDAVRRAGWQIDTIDTRRISRGVNPDMGQDDPRPAGQATTDLINHIVERLTPASPKPAAPDSPKK